MLNSNPLFVSRLNDVGYVSVDLVGRLGLSGPGSPRSRVGSGGLDQRAGWLGRFQSPPTSNPHWLSPRRKSKQNQHNTKPSRPGKVVLLVDHPLVGLVCSRLFYKVIPSLDSACRLPDALPGRLAALVAEHFPVRAVFVGIGLGGGGYWSRQSEPASGRRGD